MTGNVIIVGAPRSGTNMLRDVLSALPGFGTWPCDEINLIWKHGNRAYPSDELRPEHVTPDVTAFLRAEFAKIGRAQAAHTVVEKTCATSLRVEYVAKSFPDARYVFIYRDGLDAAASAMDRWHAPFELAYTARKARYVPISDIPYYARVFATRTLDRRGSATRADRKVTTWWGPRPDDAAVLQTRHQLDELAMIQWQRCVDAARRGLVRLNPDQVLHVQYEQFVREPREELARILEFVGHPDLTDEADVSQISTRSIGKGRASFDGEAVARLEALAADTLTHFGYA